MSEAFDWAWLREATRAPELTLDVWSHLPEDVCRRIEVENGRIIFCESASPSHQAVQFNLQAALREAVTKSDADAGGAIGCGANWTSCSPRCPSITGNPDVVVYRCIPDDRSRTGRWRDRPTVADTLLVVEVVSRSTVIEDLQTKRALYARAGIPHYWIVRMAGDDGPAVSLERLVLSSDGTYVTEGMAVRDRGLFAVDTLNPVRIQVPWDELDAGL